MFKGARSVGSFGAVFAVLLFALTSSMSAQISERVASPSKAPALAPAAVLYANNNLVSGTGNGANGSNTSSVATTPVGFNSFGAGINGAGTPDVILGERFTLTGASTISSIVFYAYSTAAASGAYGNPPSVPFTGAIVNIWNGRPGSGGVIIATSSTFGGSAWTGVYRVSSTTLTNSQRPIFSVQTNFPDTPLLPGNYWATATITNIIAPGVTTSCFSPPITNPDLSMPTTYPNGGSAASVISVDGGTVWADPVDTGTSTHGFFPILVNGTITTAAGVDVSGRVFTSADGRALRGALVTMTDQAGHIRTALTGPRGTYAFSDVEAGQTYIVSVKSRRFSFSPRVVQIIDNIADLDFVPE